MTPGPTAHDLAGGFVAGDERQPRRLVEAGAEIDVDEIQADGVLADANLAGSRRRHIHVLIHQGFRTPYLVHAHGLGHDSFSLGICLQAPRSEEAIEAALSTRRPKPAIWRTFLRLRLASTLNSSTAAAEHDGEIDVTARDVEFESVRHQRHADQHQERQRQHLGGRMIGDEFAPPAPTRRT